MMLYNEKDLQILLTRTKRSFVLFAVFLSLSIVSISCFIGFAFYEARTLFQVLGSVSSLLLAFPALYFLDRNLFYKGLATEYVNLFKEEGESLIAKVEEMKRKPITLNGGSRVYEVVVSQGKKKKTLFLSSLFDPSLEIGKVYVFQVVSNYIKGYANED